jgi:hypothetical protein
MEQKRKPWVSNGTTYVFGATSYKTAFWSILNRFEVKIHPSYNADYAATVAIVTDQLNELVLCNSTKHDPSKTKRKVSCLPFNVGRQDIGVYSSSFGTVTYFVH